MTYIIRNDSLFLNPYPIIALLIILSNLVTASAQQISDGMATGYKTTLILWFNSYYMLLLTCYDHTNSKIISISIAFMAFFGFIVCGTFAWYIYQYFCSQDRLFSVLELEQIRLERFILIIVLFYLKAFDFLHYS